MERQKFEESFRDAFKDAEIAPSDSVWTNVELDLEKETGGKMKRRLLFFQLLAAASMVFAMGVGSVYYLNKPSVSQPTAQNDPNGISQNENTQESITVNPSATNIKPSISDHPATAEASISNNKKSLPTQSDQRPVEVLTAMTENSVLAEPVDKNTSQILLSKTKPTDYGKRSLPSLVDFKEPKLKASTTEADPGLVLLAKLKDEERQYQNAKPEMSEKIWTSLGMGAGTYNPNTPSASSSLASLNSFGNTPVSSNPSSGASYSVGISIGGKVAQRIVIQGGISYLSNNAEFTSSAAAGEKAALNEFADISNKSNNVSSSIKATSPYQVNTNLQYMSIPLQAGYIIIDRTFAVQLNGGLSTDLFFQSTLTPEDESLDKISQGAGSDSPYRTVNFSGLVGTELSYKVGNHYRIAVNPGMRYALNSIYKAEVDSQISPVTFDVALRFKYIFK